MFNIIQYIPEKIVFALDTDSTETVTVVYTDNKISSVNFHIAMSDSSELFAELIYYPGGNCDLSVLLGRQWQTLYDVGSIIESVLVHKELMPSPHIATVINLKQILCTELPTMQFDDPKLNQTVTDLKQLFNVS